MLRTSDKLSRQEYTSLLNFWTIVWPFFLSVAKAIFRPLNAAGICFITSQIPFGCLPSVIYNSGRRRFFKFVFEKNFTATKKEKLFEIFGWITPLLDGRVPKREVTAYILFSITGITHNIIFNEFGMSDYYIVVESRYPSYIYYTR